MLSKLDHEPKCQGHSRNQKTTTWGQKNMPPKKFEQVFLSNWRDVDAETNDDSSKTIGHRSAFMLFNVNLSQC